MNFLASQDLLGSFYSRNIPTWPSGVAGSMHVAPLQQERDAMGIAGHGARG